MKVDKYTVSDALYFAGVFLWATTFATVIIPGFLNVTFPSSVVTISAFLGCLLLTGEFLIRKMDYFISLWSFKVVKGLLGILTGAVAITSAILAKQQINEALFIDPTNFLHATAVIAPVFALKIWLVIAAVSLLVYMLCRTVVGVVFRERGFLSYREFFGATATLLIIGSGLLLYDFLPIMSSWQHFVGNVLLKTEFYSHSTCSNHATGEKVKRLGNGDLMFLKYDPDFNLYYSYTEPCEQ